jgi:hypothetical protein
MPLFMDMHRKIEGLTSGAAAQAHKMDLAVQETHGVQYLMYWFNEESGRLYCLVEAPSAEAARLVPREAHGLLADELTEVTAGL